MIGEEVENFLQTQGDLFLGGGRLSDLIFLNLVAGVRIFPATASVGPRRRHRPRVGGQRVALPQRDTGLIHLLEHAIQQPGELQLAARDPLQFGGVLRREIASSRVNVRRPDCPSVRRAMSS